MKQYQVTIRATVTKTYTVEAENADKAIETGHEIFSVLEDGADEDYDQDVLSVEEMK
jgi:hypothetical protein